MTVAPRLGRVAHETSKERVKWRNAKEFKNNGGKVEDGRGGSLGILDYTLINFLPVRRSFLTTGTCYAQFATLIPTLTWQQPLSIWDLSPPAFAVSPVGWGNAFTVLIS